MVAYCIYAHIALKRVPEWHFKLDLPQLYHQNEYNEW